MSFNDALSWERDIADHAKRKRTLRAIRRLSIPRLRAIVTSDWPWGAEVRKAVLRRLIDIEGTRVMTMLQSERDGQD